MTRNILCELEKQVADAEFFKRARFADMFDSRLMVKLLILLDENFTQADGKTLIKGLGYNTF